jgi:hypothetical protein
MELENLKQEHINVIRNACEIYARLHVGQLENVVTDFGIIMQYYNEKTDKDAITYHLNELKRLIFKLEPNTSLAIGNAPEQAKIAFELYCLMKGKIDKISNTPLPKLNDRYSKIKKLNI